jgi:mono/diheme cytochrome c family protein
MKKSILVAAAITFIGSRQIHAETKVDFAKDIQPIFQQSCIKCHGPEKQKADLRLDSKAAALKGGKDGVVLIPGQADKSDLYHRITLAPGSDDIMPSKGDLLTKAQTDLIRDWISQGATWPEGVVAAATEAPASKSEALPASPYASLVEIKSPGSESGAISKLESSGVAVRPIAMNMNWREANFHTQGTNITDASVAPLKDVVTLVDLNLAGTRVTDAGLQGLDGLTNLVALHLEHTKITDAGLAHLKNLSHLAYLNLYDTPITDKGLEQLKGLGSLKHVYVWQTKVTGEGVAGLQKALPNARIDRGWENDPAAKKEDKKEEKKDEKKEAKK